MRTPWSTVASGPITALSRYFEAGAALRSQRTGTDDQSLAVRVSFAAVLGAVVFRDWLFPPGAETDAAIETAFTEFVLNGLGD